VLCIEAGEVPGEAVASAVPALLVAVARRNGIKARLMKRKLCPASVLGEGECNMRFQA